MLVHNGNTRAGCDTSAAAQRMPLTRAGETSPLRLRCSARRGSASLQVFAVGASPPSPNNAWGYSCVQASPSRCGDHSTGFGNQVSRRMWTHRGGGISLPRRRPSDGNGGGERRGTDLWNCWRRKAFGGWYPPYVPPPVPRHGRWRVGRMFVFCPLGGYCWVWSGSHGCGNAWYVTGWSGGAVALECMKGDRLVGSA